MGCLRAAKPIMQIPATSIARLPYSGIGDISLPLVELFEIELVAFCATIFGAVLNKTVCFWA